MRTSSGRLYGLKFRMVSSAYSPARYAFKVLMAMPKPFAVAV